MSWFSSWCGLRLGHRERWFCTRWQCPVFEEGRGGAIFPTSHPLAPWHLLLHPGCPSLHPPRDPQGQGWTTITTLARKISHVGMQSRCLFVLGAQDHLHCVRLCEEWFKHWGGVAFVSHSLGISSALYIELGLFTGKICSTEGPQRTDESHFGEGCNCF